MEQNPFKDVPQLDVRTAFDRWKGGEAAMVDVREPSEWDQGHVDGIVWIPLDQLSRRWRELDPSKQWICVCRRGNRSNYAAAMLRQAGIDASNMAGGMLDWKSKGLPITPPGIVE
jgi:rhodanese-related sulfurtransferase